jgi:23S rRNA pseudouridine2605 synthase
MLSKSGFSSRSQARQIIEQGRVSVDGKVRPAPGLWVDPFASRILVDGRPLKKADRVYLVMHKPPGVITTRSDEKGRKTVYDLLRSKDRWVFPIGRLDKETSGLLLLTNDTQFGELVTNPLEKIAKEYEVRVDRPLDPRHQRIMEDGMLLRNGTRLKRAVIKKPGQRGGAFIITIREGKNRQIRRMCEELGYAVLELKRVSIGGVRLGSLPVGAVRPLTTAERDALVMYASGKGSR